MLLDIWRVHRRSGQLRAHIVPQYQLLESLQNRNYVNKCTNKVMNLIEQIGRYGCIILMWLPLFVWDLGFSSKDMFLIYFLGNGLLLFLYMIFWKLYFRRKSKKVAIALAIIPLCIFLLSGLIFHHWTLVVFAVLFGIGYIYKT